MSIIAKWLLGDSATDRNSDVSSYPPRRCLCLSLTESEDTRECLGDEFLNALSKSKLEELDLSYDDLRSEEFTKLMAALKACQQHLKVLDIGDYNMSNNARAIATFLESIGNARSLTELNLNNCKLSDKSLTNLSRQLCHLPYLKTLDLGRRQNFSENCITTCFLPALEQMIELEDLIMEVETFHIRRRMRLICDVNRCGRRFLLKTTRRTTTKNEKGLHHPAALWPKIFNRVNQSPYCLLPNRWVRRKEQRQQSRGFVDDLFDDISDEDFDEFIDSANFFDDFDEDSTDGGGDDDGDVHAATTTTTNRKVDEDDKDGDFVDTSNIRRASVIYFLLTNGAMIDCLS